MPMSTDSSALSIAVGARSLARLTAAQVEVRGKALDLVAATDLLITAAGVFGTRSPSVAAFHHCAAKTRHMKLRRSMSPRQMFMPWVAQVSTSARESHDMNWRCRNRCDCSALHRQFLGFGACTRAGCR